MGAWHKHGSLARAHGSLARGRVAPAPVTLAPFTPTALLFTGELIDQGEGDEGESDLLEALSTPAAIGAIAGSVGGLLCCCVLVVLWRRRRAREVPPPPPPPTSGEGARRSVARKRYSQFAEHELTAVPSTPQPPPPAGAPALPPGWALHMDDASGQPYFFNEDTGEARWDAPTK